MAGPSKQSGTDDQSGQGPSYPNPNVQGNPYIYLAVYSSVPVYEMMVRGIGVMRRRSDSFLNATQILKVAGVDKGKRTKILEKDIAAGHHEKVQGGYGRYQGTWIPFERAVELSNAFGVSHLLAPLFDYTPPPPPTSLGSSSSQPIMNRYQPSTTSAPQEGGQTAAAALNKAREQGLLPGADLGRKRSRESNSQDEFKRPKIEIPNGLNGGPYLNGQSQGSWQLRHSTKCSPPVTDDPARLEHHKSALKAIFSIEAESADAVPDLSHAFPVDIDADMPIDENLHTALHWAAALARISIVRGLIEYGADMYRGNNVGETPLIRAVLVTNNSDQDAFPRLLQVLGPSLRTVDDSGRTVLHHAALVAGVKGRASSARYYLESVLEYVARNEKGHFREIVDAQDAHGDTALNIAARIGNRALVRMLVEVGADKAKANKLDLRPGDFGIETEELAVTAGEEAIEAARAGPSTSLPLQKSSEVVTSLTNLINSLSSQFEVETKDKTTALESTRTRLRNATRQLAEQRQLVASLRDKVSLVDQKQLRIKNLERALADEESFDWTGRTEIDGQPALTLAGPGFTYRGPGSTLTNTPQGIDIEFAADPTGPSEGAPHALVHLLRLQSWYERVMGLLDQRVRKLEGGEIELETKLQRVVARCCQVEPDKIEGMLEGLLAALESDGSNLEMGRVAAFLSRVKDGSLQ